MCQGGHDDAEGNAAPRLNDVEFTPGLNEDLAATADRWHRLARLWRTPRLGELSNRLWRRPLLALALALWGARNAATAVRNTVAILLAGGRGSRLKQLTDWRAKLQREMNEVDNRAIGRAVDSLLNYETVKYFGAEEREARRYDEAVGTFTRAAAARGRSVR